MSDFKEALINCMKVKNMLHKLDIFTIYHIQSILGPQKSLMDVFCKEVLTPLLDEADCLQWKDVYGKLRAVRNAPENPFVKEMDKLLELEQAPLDNNPKRLFWAMVYKVRKSGQNKPFLEYELKVDRQIWHEQKKSLKEIYTPLIHKKLIRKNGDGLQLLVQAHYLVSSDWLENRLTKYKDHGPLS